MFVFVAKNDIHQMKQSANQILTINNNLMENNHSLRLKRTLQLYYLVLLMGGNQHNVPIMKILFAKGAQFWG